MRYDPLEDFRVFLVMYWQFLKLPPPTRAQLLIAMQLQYGPRRDLILCFRGIGKSWITTAYVLWCILRHYHMAQVQTDLNILVVSQAKLKAIEFATMARRSIEEWSFLHHLRPRPDQRDSVLSFDVAPAGVQQAPTVRAEGINGQITGARADIIVPDDVETPGNSITQHKRARLDAQVKEFDAILKPGGSVKGLGTPQCEDSIYNRLYNRGFVNGVRLYSQFILPARYPDAELLARYGDRLSRHLREDLVSGRARAGDPTDAERFDEDDLIEREMSYGKLGWAMQFMLDTAPSDALKQPLKLKDLIVHDADIDAAPLKLAWAGSPEYTINDLPAMGLSGDLFQRPMFIDEAFSAYQGKVMTIDPAGKGADRVGYAVAKQLNGFIYVTDAGSIDGGYDEKTLTKLALIARDQKVELIKVEPNFGGEMFCELFKQVLMKHHKASVELGDWAHVQKERRIADILEPVMARHRLVVDPKVIRADVAKNSVSENIPHSLFYQMTRLTREKGCLVHDDALDALAMAVQHWTDRVGIDADAAAERIREEQLDEATLAFLNGINTDFVPGGGRPSEPNLLGDL
jgi:hypothetical protein